ncbi:hypothetical protein SO802_002958 [Lithocarpus litseifolius]|uniref:Late embryogenesis abundant protein LEA-2 subgroup domain-containing protein n=1 Tax=Lithocarpus litseifolius TaxID=425828 RepID=A0AAW2E0F2_9ROSI
MAERTNQQVYPLAPSNGNPRSDEESNTLQSKELKRKKRVKLAIYIAAFAVFQTIVILVFALTVMRVRTPKVRLGTDVTFSKLNTGNETSPSFDITFIAQVRVKNTNFGPYKYDSTTAFFKYQDEQVGQVTIPKGKAGLRSTKKVSVTVGVNLNALQTTSSNLGNDLKKEVLTLNGQAKFTGKVELMFVMKKKKATEMNCTMIIYLPSKTLKDLICK